ncbi:hypothetical protein Vafri_1171 [Volvox africanus]|nr:hypothetical protein Vafri_1171 [Volvox africanus]
MLVPKGRRCVGVGIPGVTAEAVSSRPRPAAAGGAVPLRKRPTAVGSAVRLKSAVEACLLPRGAAVSMLGSLGLPLRCLLLGPIPAAAGGAVPLCRRLTTGASAVWWKFAYHQAPIVILHPCMGQHDKIAPRGAVQWPLTEFGKWDHSSLGFQ